MDIIIRATPEEWEIIGLFIQKSCKSWRVERTFDRSVVVSPKAYFDDRLQMFNHLYGHHAELSLVLGLDDRGRFRVKLKMTAEDATLLRMFHNENIEMVATD